MPEVDYELYKLITVSGADATQFLQGQLTQDVALLAGKPRAWPQPAAVRGDGLLRPSA